MGDPKSANREKKINIFLFDKQRRNICGGSKKGEEWECYFLTR